MGKAGCKLVVPKGFWPKPGSESVSGPVPWPSDYDFSKCLLVNDAGRRALAVVVCGDGEDRECCLRLARLFAAAPRLELIVRAALAQESDLLRLCMADPAGKHRDLSQSEVWVAELQAAVDEVDYGPEVEVGT